jgi:hypothetical protein
VRPGWHEEPERSRQPGYKTEQDIAAHRKTAVYEPAGHRDVFDGQNSAPNNPWGNCHSAPYSATVNHGGGTWDKLDSVAKTLDWSFSAFGLFEGHGHTGIHHEQRNQIREQQRH